MRGNSPVKKTVAEFNWKMCKSLVKSDVKTFITGLDKPLPELGTRVKNLGTSIMQPANDYITEKHS